LLTDKTSGAGKNSSRKVVEGIVRLESTVHGGKKSGDEACLSQDTNNESDELWRHSVSIYHTSIVVLRQSLNK